MEKHYLRQFRQSVQNFNTLILTMILSYHHIEMLCPADNCLYFKVNNVSYCFSPWDMDFDCSVLIGDTWNLMRTDSEMRGVTPEERATKWPPVEGTSKS